MSQYKAVQPQNVGLYNDTPLGCTATQHTHLGRVLQVLLLLGPVGPSLPEGQAGVGQLQCELGGLQPGLVDLRLPVVPLGHRGAQVRLQAVDGALAGAQTLAQAAHVLQRRLALRLRGRRGRWPHNLHTMKVYT